MAFRGVLFLNFGKGILKTIFREEQDDGKTDDKDGFVECGSGGV